MRGKQNDISVNHDENQYFGRNKEYRNGTFQQKKTQSDKQELRYLSRKDILELLREQTRRSAAFEKEINELKTKLKEQEAALQNARAIAEEAICISEVFEKAISDSRKHVTNMQRMNMEQFTDNELEQHEDRYDSEQSAD